MNRTDRLYALVEELRASAPRRRSARELAERYEVSVRTIERDIGALQQAGVPIYADTGRRGGYTIDSSRTLPPLNFSPAEAVAVAVALNKAGGSPYERFARTALHKILAAMSAADGAEARDLAGRIHFLVPTDDPASVPAVVEEAVADRRVVRLLYVDRNGVKTEREVEPIAFLSGTHGWYFIGWCRLRDEPRSFRVDRIHQVDLLDQKALPRDCEDLIPRLPDRVAQTLRIA